MLDLTNFFKLLVDRGVAAEISKATGISSGNISDWKSGRSKPTSKTIIKIAEHLNYSIDYLLGRTDIKELPKQSESVIHLIDMGEIIYIDTHPQPVSAGKGNIYIDDLPISKLYPSTSISLKADYCVRISGDSMFPEYLNGDIVYVEENIPKHNDIGIFLYNGEAFCKKYYDKDGIKKMISLNPDQEKYMPIVIENDSFEAQGRVIGKFHAD